MTTALQPQNPKQLLSPEQFKVVSSIAKQHAGLEISDQKNAMVHARLTKRMRQIGVQDLGHYLAIISGPKGKAEMPEFISALTTNVTSFYREAHHFKTLNEVVIPKIKEKLSARKPVRLWSAGCSEGMELLTILMELTKAIPDLTRHDIRLLGSDIDLSVLKKARSASYSKKIANQIAEDDLERFFDRQGDEYRFKKEPMGIVRYNRLNLLSEWPFTLKFDAIFCRNVVIYFEEETRNQLWPRFWNSLKGDGLLFLGHSERISGDSEKLFDLIGTTTYRPTQNTAHSYYPQLQKDMANGFT